jgi:hypothetical protein
MTPADFLRELDAALHEMRVLPVNDYGATNWIAICSCAWESVQMTRRDEAEAQVAAGCPVEALDRQSAKRRAARLQQEKAWVA